MLQTVWVGLEGMWQPTPHTDLHAPGLQHDFQAPYDFEQQRMLGSMPLEYDHGRGNHISAPMAGDWQPPTQFLAPPVPIMGAHEWAAAPQIHSSASWPSERVFVEIPILP